MSLCCSTYNNLGCFNHCDSVHTGILVADAGTYIIQLEFNGGITELSVTLAEGEEIIIYTVLNENYIYTFRVLDEEGEVLNDTCYRFQAQLIDDRSAAHEVIYLNNISGLTLSGTGTNTLTITLTDKEYINGSTTPLYRVDDGYGGDFALPLNDTTGMDISNFADGDYLGFIYCDDGYTISKLYFVFSIADFLVSACMPMCNFLLGNFSAGNNMSLDIITQTQSDGTDITSTITKVNSLTEDSATYPGVNDTGENTNSFSADYVNTLQTITHGVEYDSHGILFSHISFFKLS